MAGYAVDISNLVLGSRSSLSLPETASTRFSFRHTAPHTATVVVPQSVAALEEARFADAVISYGGQTLLDGEVVRVQKDEPAPGQATLKVDGPTLELKRAGPDTPLSYSNELTADAIRDYASQRGIAITVHDPPVETKADDTKVRDSANVGFSGFYSPASTEPIKSTTSELSLYQTCQINPQSQWTNNGGTFQQDSSGQSNYHITGDYIVLDNDLDNIETTFSWGYDLPADRVGVAVSAVLVGSGSGTSPLTFNGVQLDNVVTTGDQPGGDWFVFDTEYAANGGSDLTAGTSYTADVTLNSTGFDLEIDAIAVYDTKYPPGTWDEPSSLGGTIAGPELYPVVTIEMAPETRPWNVAAGRVDATVNDTSNQFRWRLSPNGGADWVTVANQADASADFEAAGYYGATEVAELRFGGYDDGSGGGAVPTNRNATQTLTSLKQFVTTNTRSVIASIELSDSDFENLRTLHEKGGMRFVADPATTPVDLESFAPDDSSIQKPASWRATGESSADYDVTGYANEVTIVGPSGAKFTMRDDDEVSRLGGRVISTPPIHDPDADTADKRRIRAREELLKRTGQDDPAGTIEAVPQVILPGYPYPTPWGTSALERVDFSESGTQASMTLDFSGLDLTTKRLIEHDRGIRDLRKG